MKIGDLVKWSDVNAVWHSLNYITSDLAGVRQRGVVIDRNPRYYFVLWENGEWNANCHSDLEIISES
jgi:hypothetical protein